MKFDFIESRVCSRYKCNHIFCLSQRHTSICGCHCDTCDSPDSEQGVDLPCLLRLELVWLFQTVLPETRSKLRRSTVRTLILSAREELQGSDWAELMQNREQRSCSAARKRGGFQHPPFLDSATCS